ncbi:unnamed protein product [Prorocentrum cordatum]|uniref:Uncharacterized protein n=1 Tax=Prorocentrum cordatum TaxID=2364126 RepID=A0ABN9Y413_9DINO|nr:unnamed protein product [Polarella glacialis]
MPAAASPPDSSAGQRMDEVGRNRIVNLLKDVAKGSGHGVVSLMKRAGVQSQNSLKELISMPDEKVSKTARKALQRLQRDAHGSAAEGSAPEATPKKARGEDDPPSGVKDGKPAKRAREDAAGPSKSAKPKQKAEDEDYEEPPKKTPTEEPQKKTPTEEPQKKTPKKEDSKDPPKQKTKKEEPALRRKPIIGKQNSTTKKAEWKQFMRLAANPKRWPADLNTPFENNKNDLFNKWLACDKSVPELPLTIKRELEEKESVKREWTWMKRRDMEEKLKYSTEKLDQLVAKRTKQGWYEDDEDFPGDLEERYYAMKMGMSLTLDSSRSTKTALQGQTAVKGQAAKKLLKPGGLFSSGARLNVPGMSEKASEKFWQETGDDGGSRTRSSSGPLLASRPPRQPKAIVEKTPVENAKAKISDMIKQTGEAKKMSCSALADPYTTAIGEDLKKHHGEVDELHGKLMSLVRDNPSGQSDAFEETVEEWEILDKKYTELKSAAKRYGDRVTADADAYMQVYMLTLDLEKDLAVEPTNAPVLIPFEMCGGLFWPGLNECDQYKAMSYHFKKVWCKEKGVSAPAVSLSAITCGRADKSNYPSLSSSFKAASIKAQLAVLISYAADVAYEKDTGTDILQREAAVTELTESKREIEERFHQAEASRDTACEALSRLQGGLSSSSEEKEAERKERLQVEADLKETRRSAAQALSMNSELSRERDEALERLREGDLARRDLEARLDAAASELRELESSREGGDSEADALRGQLECQGERLARLEAERDQLDAVHRRAEAELQGSARRAEAELEESRRAAAELQAELEDARRAAADLQDAEHRRAEAELEDSRGAATELRDSARRAEAELEESRRAAAELQAPIVTRVS